MRKLLLSTAALGMIAAGGASAQVLDSVDDILAGLTTIQTGAQAAVSNVAGVAQNTAEIDASIVINSLGQGTAEQSRTFTLDDSLDTTAMLSVRDLSNTAGFSFADEGGGFASLDDCLVGAAGDESGSGECILSVERLLEEATENTRLRISDGASASQRATTQDFGAVAATAIGAANLHDINIAMSGVTAGASSAANTSTTAANAASDTVFAASVNALNIADNAAEIDASFTGDFLDGNVSFKSIATTAIGAANIGGISAAINTTNSGISSVFTSDDG